MRMAVFPTPGSSRFISPTSMSLATVIARSGIISAAQIRERVAHSRARPKRKSSISINRGDVSAATTASCRKTSRRSCSISRGRYAESNPSRALWTNFSAASVYLRARIRLPEPNSCRAEMGSGITSVAKPSISLGVPVTSVFTHSLYCGDNWLSTGYTCLFDLHDPRQ